MKKLIISSSLFLLGFVLAPQTQGETYWAAAYTEAANSDKSLGGDTANYSGYYCTVKMANQLFKGADTVDAVTAYLSANFADGYKAINDELSNTTAHPGGASDLGLLAVNPVGYDHGQYELKTTFGDSLALFGSEFLAVLLYDNGSKHEFRVMSSDSAEIAYGNAFFNTAAPGSTSTAGNWTAVPEPTSSLLLLLGVAGLALVRKNRSLK